MNNVDLSLDEIIKLKKGGSEGRLKSAIDDLAGRNVKRRGRGFQEKYADDAKFNKTREVPRGKWDHSGFEELYGSNARAREKPVRSVPVSRKIRDRRAISRKVKLHMTNLASTVTTTDLCELFEDYPIESANVHYDELGMSTGTADVTTDLVSAEEIKSNYTGVALDGHAMHFHIIDDAPEEPPSRMIESRLSFPIAKTHSRTIQKRRETLPRMKVTAAPRRGRRKVWSDRKQMTDAELDRELEEYMKKKSDTSMET